MTRIYDHFYPLKRNNIEFIFLFLKCFNKIMQVLLPTSINRKILAKTELIFQFLYFLYYIFIFRVTNCAKLLKTNN